MSPVQTLISFSYLAAAAFFIYGLKGLGSPATAVKGNRAAAIGMLIAVVVTLIDSRVISYTWIISGLLVGSVIGAFAARLVKMTQMPQMVALFNGLGGGASALVACGEYLRISGHSTHDPVVLIAIMFSVFIGGITWSGSMIAFAKLQGILKGTPITFPLQQPVNILLALACTALGVFCFFNPAAGVVFLIFVLISLLIGKLVVLPIGGADMPVVISLLNSLSGLAASMAGFIIMNQALIISGALVGASGLILTQIMCKAMNRSIANVLFGSFGKAGQAAESSGDKTVRSVGPEEAAMVLGYAASVVVVPGYGMAVAQAQHAVRELSDELRNKGVEVKFAIHPVAGRMPGHMNVLLAEANVPYEQLREMENINPEFPKTDVVLVIGANDVVNPAAKTSPGSPIYGMPVLEVDKAKNIIVIKRSLNPGFAGIDNELFYNEKTMMLFGGAKDAAEKLVQEIKSL